MKLCTSAIGAALTLMTAPTLACGYCIEDKVAAAYDHAVMARALGQRHEVLFLSLEFTRPVSADAAVSIRNTAEGIVGVDRGSVRVAVESGALSLAYDPRRVAVADILKTLDRDLARWGVSFALLRVDGTDGKSSSAESGAARAVSTARVR